MNFGMNDRDFVTFNFLFLFYFKIYVSKRSISGVLL